MPDPDHAETVAELRRLRGELARLFDLIPYTRSTDDTALLRQLTEKVASDLSELIDLLRA